MAVIIILAIVAMISIPQMTDIIKISQKEAFKSSVSGVIQAAEYKPSIFQPGTCISYKNLDFKNKEQFTEGQVCKSDNQKLTVENLCNKNYCANGSNDNLVITEASSKPEIDITTLPILKRRQSNFDFFIPTYYNTVVTFKTVTTNQVPETATASFDMSANKDKSVMAWIIPNSIDQTKNDLYLGGNNGILAPDILTNYFTGFALLKTIDLSNFYTNNTNNMASMFENLKVLTDLNIKNFNTKNVTTFARMFADCRSLKEIDISHFDMTNTVNLYGMFIRVNANKINLSGIKSTKVTTTESMFYECKNLLHIDLSGFQTSNLTNMFQMFRDCNSLQELNINHFDTTKLTNMGYAFYKCHSIKTLDLSNLKGNSITTLDRAFYEMKEMTYLNISGLTGLSLTNMDAMFVRDAKLKNINFGNIDTSKVTTMNSMFLDCTSIEEINLTSFTTLPNIITTYMFAGTSSLNKVKASSIDKFKLTSTTAFSRSKIKEVTYDI